jgi:hypothetical protein
MNLEETKQATVDHFDNPIVGDRFHEMYSFWVHVVLITAEKVIVEEYCPPCSVPKDAKVRIFNSRDEFRAAYSYTSIQGSFLYYCDNKAPVDHWRAVP